MEVGMASIVEDIKFAEESIGGEFPSTASMLRYVAAINAEATEYSPAKNEWVRWGGDYYSKIVQLDDGRIRVGSHFFGRRKQA